MNKTPPPKPPDYDEDLEKAIQRFRERHQLPENDAVLLLVELFRIHQQHWDALRRREMPSFEQFRSDIGLLANTAKSVQQQVAALLDALKNQPSIQPTENVSFNFALFAIISALLGGYLIGRGWR
jgi:hypothetical protein